MTPRQQFDPPEMAAHLSAAIERGLPGHAAQRSMAHGLAYGRHRGPIPDDARRAAVLLALDPSSTGWSIPALLRPATMRSHAGQVSLPVTPDPGVVRGTAAVVANLPEAQLNRLLRAASPITDIRLEVPR